MTFNEKIKGRLGYTIGDRLYDAEYGKEGDGDFYSWILGVTYKVKQNIELRYSLENLTRAKIFHDAKSTVFVDIKFLP